MLIEHVLCCSNATDYVGLGSAVVDLEDTLGTKTSVRPAESASSSSAPKAPAPKSRSFKAACSEIAGPKPPKAVSTSRGKAKPKPKKK